MKIAVTATGPSLDANVDPRFGRCRWFLIVETDDLSFDAVENPNANLGGGAGIQSAQLMAERRVKHVLTGNCGPNAHQTLSAAGIGVVVGCSGTVRDVVEGYKSGQFATADQPNVGSHFGMPATPPDSASPGGAVQPAPGSGQGPGGGRGMGGGGGRGMGGGGRGMGGGGRGMGGGGRGMAGGGRGMGGGGGRGMGGGGRGMGRGGGRGMGRGQGMGPGGGFGGGQPTDSAGPDVGGESELALLKQQAEALSQQMQRIQQRIENLQQEKARGGEG
jgi:predicted Fe-Mo cluster-binding NifX family protein